MGRQRLPVEAVRVPPAQRGFTLGEAMVAVGILALIGTLTFGTFARSMAARDQAMLVTEHYHQVRQAMLRMSREISMAFLSDHRDCREPRTRTAFIGKRSSGGTRLDFTSFSHFKMLPDANESDQNELGYYVGRPPKGSGLTTNDTVLIRRMQSRIDERPDEGGVEEVLAENVRDISFEFYDPKDDRWVDSWDTTRQEHRGRMPMFVAIKLKVKGLNGKDEQFVTKTRVFLQRSIRIMGTGFPGCPDD